MGKYISFAMFSITSGLGLFFGLLNLKYNFGIAILLGFSITTALFAIETAVDAAASNIIKAINNNGQKEEF